VIADSDIGTLGRTVKGNGVNRENSKACDRVRAERHYRTLRNRKRSRNPDCNLAAAAVTATT